MPLKRRIIFTIMVVAITIVSLGCASILEERERVTENPHVFTVVERPPEAQIEVSSFEELKDAILDLIIAHETSGRMIVYSFDSEDVQADLYRAIYEITTYNPIAVFAVNEIIAQATKIVAFFEVEVNIEYRRTQQQVESIMYLPEMQYLRDELLVIMGDYRDEAVFRTTMQLTEHDLLNLISEIYYQNPRKIVMLPIVAIEVFPEIGEDRIFRLSFGHAMDADLLRELSRSLYLAVRGHIAHVYGETDAERLLSLAEHLIAFADFDEVRARALSEHGVQNLAATAFGALINSSAIGEGFAMAFKALSDELGIYNRVVLGFMDGVHHAWNIVYIDGYYYHIDIAMGDVYGIETAFLKSDAEFMLNYEWDMENTPRCGGPLTFYDVIGSDNYNNYEVDEDGTSASTGSAPPIRSGVSSPVSPGQNGGEAYEDEDSEAEEYAEYEEAEETNDYSDEDEIEPDDNEALDYEFDHVDE